MKENSEINHFLPTWGPGRSDMGRLYSWTRRDAERAQEKHYRKTPDLSCGPLHRWKGAQELAELYQRHCAGHEVIMDALFLCAFNSLPIPQWLERAFMDAYCGIRGFDARSWDDVFGKPHQKNAKIAARKNKREKSLIVYCRVKQILNVEPNTAIDRHLFDRAGKEFGIGDSLAEKYYLEWKKRLGRKRGR